MLGGAEQEKIQPVGTCHWCPGAVQQALAAVARGQSTGHSLRLAQVLGQWCLHKTRATFVKMASVCLHWWPLMLVDLWRNTQMYLCKFFCEINACNKNILLVVNNMDWLCLYPVGLKEHLQAVLPDLWTKM